MSGEGILGSGFALRGAKAQRGEEGSRPSAPPAGTLSINSAVNSRRDLEDQFVGRHLWLSEEFSVPAAHFCLRRNSQEGWGDTFCLRQVDHAGHCQFGFCPPVKDHDWKSLRASAPRSAQGDPEASSSVTP